MAVIIGFVALFVSLIALWMVSESAKKMSAQNESFIKAHIKGVRDTLDETRKALAKSNKEVAQLITRIDDIEVDVQHFRTARDNARKTLSKLDTGTSGSAAQPSIAAKRETG